MTDRVTIEETDAGFVVQGDVYDSLQEAIEHAGDYYTFIPQKRK